MTSYMQKFGLQTHRTHKNTAIEVEVAREQASALGRAGKTLRLSLEAYEKVKNANISQDDRRGHITRIYEHAWALILQREVLGFTENNIQWVKDNYVIPIESLRLLGSAD